MTEYYREWLPYLGPLLFVVDVVIILFTAGHIVLTKRDSRSAIGWVGVVCLTPFVGAILYIVFGVNRLQRKAQKLLVGQSWPAGSPGLQEATTEQVDFAVVPVAPNLLPLANFIRRVTDLPLLAGNRVTPFFDGDEAYGAMLAAIHSAEKTVSLATYIFDNDEIGREFVAALARAKQRGVEVRVLIDDVGTRYSWPSVKRELRRAGIPFDTFLPTLIPWQLQYTNMRNHRKIMVVDGKIGFTGGMNIRQGHSKSNSGKHPVADSHFQLEGPIVSHLQETFAFDWEFCTDEKLSGEAWFPPLTSVGPTLARGIADGPDLDSDRIQLALQGAIDCAQRSLTIVTPYFLPEQALVTALNVAAMRGVEVKIVLPQQGNLRLVQWAATAQYWQLLQRGCRIFLTPPPFDHTKIVLIDDLWVMFGSANWDPRSLRLNFEFNVECYDQPLAARLGAVVREKIAAAHETSLEEVDSRPLWKKLRDGVARLAQPYL